MNRLFLVTFLVLLLLLTACIIPTPTKTPSPLPTFQPPPLEVPDAGFVETQLQMEVNIMDLQTLLVAAGFLALVANRLVEGLVTPFFDKFKWDKFWLLYIAWLIGGVLVGFSGINLFTSIPGVTMPNELGLVLSGLVAGGGSNLLNELFDWLGQGRRGLRP